MERLQKVIAHAGVASRRNAEKLILEGKVKVNGKVEKELGVKVSPSDRVEVNGIQLEKKESVIFFSINQEALYQLFQMIKEGKLLQTFFHM